MNREPSSSARWASTSKPCKYTSSNSTPPRKPKSASPLRPQSHLLTVPRYCNQVYLAAHSTPNPAPGVPASDAVESDTDDANAAPSVYHTLLSLYLNPPPPHQPRADAALALLSAHGARLPASQTLALIPPDQRVATLERYFTGRMRAAASRARLEQVEARLRGVMLAGVEARLAAEKARGVVVSEERLCGVCMKRFGGSAVRVWPDGRVAHYGCFDGGARRERAWG
jgi:hypothetical protein